MSPATASPAANQPAIAVVIPCYRVKAQILEVLAAVPPAVRTIYCVDDGCPEHSGAFVESNAADPRVVVLYNHENRGVGGAMITGYRRALADGTEIVVKIDGDGQMDPRLLDKFVDPIRRGASDYTKGNRFFRLEGLSDMPLSRLLGNALLTFMSKLSSGYWHIFDPTNGYTAIHAAVLNQLPLDKISPRYFFESDMLFRLSTVRAVVTDVPMTAVYGDRPSGLVIHRIMLPFLGGHAVNFLKRIFYNYFLRDFQIASVEWILGPILALGGFAFGLARWIDASAANTPATAGTVMVAALPIIVGVQMILGALNYDIQNTPQRPLHPALEPPAPDAAAPRADRPYELERR
ncbi:MAG: glycosyltransferase family 2 protein [Alphaproteobacteria bacterium]|nr:glycosyltransferase family 2 protein [Alphaproteobacteria bacterium]